MRRLKKWVKVVILLVLLVLMLNISDYMYNKGVKDCVDSGNTITYCKEGLK